MSCAKRRALVTIAVLCLFGASFKNIKKSVVYFFPAPMASRDAADTEPQGARMLAARPAMAESLASRPALRNWIALRFLGVDHPFPIVWDDALPHSGQPSEYELPQARGGPGILRVTDKYSGTDQLASAIFELHNMKSAVALASTWNDAVAGRISREGFAETATRVEHRAFAEFRVTCHDYVLAPAREDIWLARLLEAPADFEVYLGWIARLRQTETMGHDPLQYWKRAYDERIRRKP
jgi:hypothetical protein